MHFCRAVSASLFFSTVVPYRQQRLVSTPPPPLLLLRRPQVQEPINLLGKDKFAEVDIRIRVKGGGQVAQIYGA